MPWLRIPVFRFSPHVHDNHSASARAWHAPQDAVTATSSCANLRDKSDQAEGKRLHERRPEIPTGNSQELLLSKLLLATQNTGPLHRGQAKDRQDQHIQQISQH